MAGISRSATIILAYLIKKYGYSVDMVLSLMKRKRPIVKNLLFIRFNQIKASWFNLETFLIFIMKNNKIQKKRLQKQILEELITIIKTKTIIIKIIWTLIWIWILIHAIQEKSILAIKNDRKKDNYLLFLNSFYLISRKKKLKEKISNLLDI